MPDEAFNHALQGQNEQKPRANQQRQQAQAEDDEGFPAHDMGKNRWNIKSEHGGSFEMHVCCMAGKQCRVFMPADGRQDCNAQCGRQ